MRATAAAYRLTPTSRVKLHELPGRMLLRSIGRPKRTAPMQ
jgi:hypothetical protein